ncbi:MAG: nitroreductase family protein [Nanohaloarchaea archaeon]|nr:nitroreductase family protein [Candidatus Nanohaloarchaea archaeon]
MKPHNTEDSENLTEEALEERDTEYEIDPIFPARWSPRSMKPVELDEEDFMPLFEAARWAPSSYNNQSWRFIYAKRGTEEWEEFLDLLSDFNRSWAEKGSVLVVVASKTTFDHNGEESRTHSFDTGAAWENLALEGARRELVVHGMQGFDYEEAREKLGVPEEFEIEAMVAIGKRAPREELNEEMKEREQVSGRKPLDETVSEGSFKF